MHFLKLSSLYSKKSHEKSQGLIPKLKIPGKFQQPQNIPRSWDKVGNTGLTFSTKYKLSALANQDVADYHLKFLLFVTYLAHCSRI